MLKPLPGITALVAAYRSGKDTDTPFPYVTLLVGEMSLTTGGE